MTASEWMHLVVPARTLVGLVMVGLSFYLLIKALADRQEFKRRGINGLVRVSMNSQVASCVCVLVVVVILTLMSFTSVVIGYARADYVWIDLFSEGCQSVLLFAVGSISLYRWWERHQLKRLAHEYMSRGSREGSKA